MTSVLKVSQEDLHSLSAQQHLDKHSDQNDIFSLIFHASDFQMTSVIDMAKVSDNVFKSDLFCLFILYLYLRCRSN